MIRGDTSVLHVVGGLGSTLVLALAVSSGIASAAIPAAERSALIDLYADTNGDIWTTNTGWKTPPLEVDGFAMPGTECSWFGITCDGGQAAVTALDLRTNGLFGSLPATVGSLTSLVNLYLGFNYLVGSIPSFAANTALQHLDLSYSQLSGSVPSFALNSALQHLDLSYCQLTGSIPPFDSNIALHDLRLSNNQLTGSIPSFASATALQVLYLDANQLTGSIPTFA